MHLAVPYAPRAALAALARTLHAAFRPPDPVVFEWALAVRDFVLDQVIERAHPPAHPARTELELRLSEDDPRAPPDARTARKAAPPREIAHAIQAFAAQAERDRLRDGSFECPVCWEDKLGTACMSLAACSHVACKECLAAFWESRIEEGRVGERDVVCPKSECKAEVSPAEVREAVAKDVYDKYERFLLQRALDGDAEMMPCPREGCVQMAAVDTDDASMGRCAYCLYVFCVACKRKWHVPLGCEEAVADDEREDAREIAERLQDATEEERQRTRAGLSVATWEKVETAMALCEMGGRLCPKCAMFIVKNGGCALMTCACGCKFCWNCGEDTFYEHYRPGGCRLYEDGEMQAVHEQIYDWIYD